MQVKISLSHQLLKWFGVAVVTSIGAAVLAQNWLFAAFPLVLLLIFVAIIDFRKIFWLLMCCIPISAEIELPGGFSTDLPTEPLIVGSMLGFILLIISQIRSNDGLDARFLRHPLTLFIGVYVMWTAVTALNSEAGFISLKYFIAKIWYIVTFYFLAGLIFKDLHNIRTFFWCIFIPLSITIIITLIRHALIGFSFEEVTYVVQPYFRNPVMYACTLALFFPFILLARTWYPSGSWQRRILNFGILLFLIGIQFSFKRVGYVALIAAIGFYGLIRLRWLRGVLLVGLCVVAIGINFLVQKNKYLDFAPRYERAITHSSFSDLLEATYKLEDISTMERVYRWVAGFRMVERHPYMGFGPGTFYTFYKSYTVRSFQTYVSDNPEHSGIHCQYLMIAVEQGIIGALIFIALCCLGLIWGEKLVQRLLQKQGTEGGQKWLPLVATVSASFFIILLLIMVNDLIETDKIGSFFFMNLAWLVNLDLETKK